MADNNGNKGHLGDCLVSALPDTLRLSSLRDLLTLSKNSIYTDSSKLVKAGLIFINFMFISIQSLLPEMAILCDTMCNT